MSYNRGGNMRRDGGGRRSNDFGGGNNRRSGGGGGGYYDNYNSGPMNPWEGGMVPGRNVAQGDLLSQLTSPEAQLALASNLINKLINQQQTSVPSLLNMGNMGSSGGHMSQGYDRMRNEGYDNYGNTRNFQDRRRGRMDQRRTEPYNKSGMNRRTGNDRRDQNRSSNFDRKPSINKSSPKGQKDDKDKKDKDAEKPNGEVKIKKESSDEAKRDEDQAEDNKSDSGEKKREKEEKKLTPIPAALLYCHVCSKNMWDELSFTKHLKGRYHELMMDGLNEKYKLKVELLRHDMKIAEQQREMELERKQRLGMKRFTPLDNMRQEYCAMCDLYFRGHLISHRKNTRHQKLKAFLHPKCTHCNKEFSTRLEWDEHRLTFSHLREVAEFRRATKPNIKDDEFDIDELVCPDTVNCGEMVSREVPLVGVAQGEEEGGQELREEPLKEREDAKRDKDDKDDEKDQVEVPQGMDADPAKLPKYNPSVQIGKDLVVAATGFLCRACNRFIPTEEESLVHCRTLSHHNNYCTIIRAKARVSGRNKKGQDKAKGGKDDDDKADEDKADDDKMDSETADADKPSETDDEGNWKRRKVNESGDNEESMDMDDSKNNVSKEDLEDSVWEEGEGEVKQEEEEEEEVTKVKEEEDDEEEEEPPKPAPRKSGGGVAPRKTPATRRGGRRGVK